MASADRRLNFRSRKSRRRFTELRPVRSFALGFVCKIARGDPLKTGEHAGRFHGLVCATSLLSIQGAGDPPSRLNRPAGRNVRPVSSFIFREVKAASRSVLQHVDAYRCVHSPRHPSTPSLLTDRFRDSVVGVLLRKRHHYVEPDPKL